MSAVFRSNIFTNLRSSTLSASMYAFSLALSAVVSAGALLFWHSYLIYTNQVCEKIQRLCCCIFFYFVNMVLNNAHQYIKSRQTICLVMSNEWTCFISFNAYITTVLVH